jgi:toxin FitB
MNVVDSCGWLEYFAAGPNSFFFAEPLEDTANLFVPTLCIYEVFKHVLIQRNKDKALQAVAYMLQGKVIELDTSIALEAAKISLDLKLPMSNSIILAATRTLPAVLWTQDADFKGIDGINYIERK